MILGITGHRKLQHSIIDISKQVENYFELSKPDLIISGMALGFDTLCVEVALDMGIPVTAAIPCDDQDKFWSITQKRKYAKLLELCTIHEVSPGPYTPDKMKIRNKWIVDNANKMLAYLIDQKGGTWHCVNYAKEKNVFTTNIVVNLEKK